MRRAPAVILFDVLDTLVHDPFYDEVLAHFGMDLPSLFAIKDKGAWHAFERGELREREMTTRYFADGRALDLDALRACMQRAYRWLPGMEALLAELRARGLELHALSNYPVWYEWIEARLGLGRYLEWSFVSCRTGIRKPDARAYTAASAALGVAPSRCLFVDDRVKNCDGARAVGMPAHHFQGAAALRRALVQEYGLALPVASASDSDPHQHTRGAQT